MDPIRVTTIVAADVRGTSGKGPMAVAALIPAATEYPSAELSVQHGLRLWSSAAAAVGSLTVTLHIWTAVAQSDDLLVSAIMLTLSLVCVPCVFAVWRWSTVRSVMLLMAMSLGCALLNLCTLVAFHHTMGMDHGGAVAHVDTVVAGPPAHEQLMLVVITLEIVTAGIAAVCVRRFTERTTTQPRK